MIRNDQDERQERVKEKGKKDITKYTFAWIILCMIEIKNSEEFKKEKIVKNGIKDTENRDV